MGDRVALVFGKNRPGMVASSDLAISLGTLRVPSPLPNLHHQQPAADHSSTSSTFPGAEGPVSVSTEKLLAPVVGAFGADRVMGRDT